MFFHESRHEVVTLLRSLCTDWITMRRLNVGHPKRQTMLVCCLLLAMAKADEYKPNFWLKTNELVVVVGSSASRLMLLDATRATRCVHLPSIQKLVPFKCHRINMLTFLTYDQSCETFYVCDTPVNFQFWLWRKSLSCMPRLLLAAIAEKLT